MLNCKTSLFFSVLICSLCKCIENKIDYIQHMADYYTQVGCVNVHVLDAGDGAGTSVGADSGAGAMFLYVGASTGANVGVGCSGHSVGCSVGCRCMCKYGCKCVNV